MGHDLANELKADRASLLVLLRLVELLAVLGVYECDSGYNVHEYVTSNEKTINAWELVDVCVWTGANGGFRVCPSRCTRSGNPQPGHLVQGAVFRDGSFAC